MVSERLKKLICDIPQIILISVVCFLALVGMQRTWELNSSEYQTMKPFCSPKGYFGLSYDCDLIAYNDYLIQKDLYDTLNISFNFTTR